ncbi:MAG: hypothetical protein Kow00109_12630 [Acidobacteriota bacterium]
MQVSDPQLVAILVYVMGGLVLLQAIGLAVGMLKLSQAVRRAEIALERLLLRSRGMVQETARLLSAVTARKDGFLVVLQQFEAAVNSAAAALHVLDQGLADLFRSSRELVRQASRQVEYALVRADKVSQQWARSTQHLAVQFRAFRKGVSAAVAVLGAGSRRRVVADEDWFI